MLSWLNRSRKASSEGFAGEDEGLVVPRREGARAIGVRLDIGQGKLAEVRGVGVVAGPNAGDIWGYALGVAGAQGGRVEGLATESDLEELEGSIAHGWEIFFVHKGGSRL